MCAFLFFCWSWGAGVAQFFTNRLVGQSAELTLEKSKTSDSKTSYLNYQNEIKDCKRFEEELIKQEEGCGTDNYWEVCRDKKQETIFF